MVMPWLMASNRFEKFRTFNDWNSLRLPWPIKCFNRNHFLCENKLAAYWRLLVTKTSVDGESACKLLQLFSPTNCAFIMLWLLSFRRFGLVWFDAVWLTGVKLNTNVQFYTYLDNESAADGVCHFWHYRKLVFSTQWKFWHELRIR